MKSNQADSIPLEKRINLPKPDPDNITVFTRELPNDPILPWHHYDSPWLNPETGEEELSKPADDQADEQAADREEGITTAASPSHPAALTQSPEAIAEGTAIAAVENPETVLDGGAIAPDASDAIPETLPAWVKPADRETEAGAIAPGNPDPEAADFTPRQFDEPPTPSET